MVKSIGVFVAALFAGVAGTSVDLRGSDASRNKFTINDQVFVDGAMYAKSGQLNNNIGCHEHSGTHEFKVCGCGVKVIAHMLTECQQYKHYDTQVGKCDCSTTECDEILLESGYTNKFNWKASSFEIAPC
mmetsp:Transcript_105461/g.303277  ORF Transcript_105461/g.303277 Transcript_105461/m.303277 type:complete len:130 (-) Transcript_105461:102-491(-)